MENIVHAKDIEELSEAVTVTQRKGQPLLLAKLMQKRPPEPPPQSLTAPPGSRP